MREPIMDAELERWAKVRADDAGHLARELITYRRYAGIITAITERRRQIEDEGWSCDHDDEHSNGEMAWAAAAYTIGVPGLSGRVQDGKRFVPWPWDAKWWKPSDSRRNLVKAAALLIAEIERVDRAARKTSGTGGGDA